MDRRSRLSSVLLHGVVPTSCAWMSLLVRCFFMSVSVRVLNLVIDYLDRESLAALIEALKVFEGGVLVITHNRDFSESLCKEYVHYINFDARS